MVSKQANGQAPKADVMPMPLKLSNLDEYLAQEKTNFVEEEYKEPFEYNIIHLQKMGSDNFTEAQEQAALLQNEAPLETCPVKVFLMTGSSSRF